jgi:hypothetical protein
MSITHGRSNKVAMNIFQSFFVFLLLLLLGGCTQPLQPDNPLQPKNYVEQLSPTWFDANRFVVAYPRKSSDEKVVDLTLLRCAEIALQNGFNYFIVINTDGSIATSSDDLTGAAAEFIEHDGIRYYHTNPASSNTIVGFKRRPQGFAYVALFVKASLRTKYGLDQPAVPI